MHKPWQLAVAELAVAGRKAEAMAILKGEMERGNLAAVASYAWRAAGEELSHAQAARLVERVEREMEQGDVDVHLQLALAYDMKVCTLAYDQAPLRRLHHIEQAAKHGAGPHVALAAARIWLGGSLGIEPDRSKAAYWYGVAEREGSGEANEERRKHGL
jgi:hypothetical protein